MTGLEQVTADPTRGRAAGSLLIAVVALAGMATTPASGRGTTQE
ncbi:MAG TPA: hypothetical protein VEU28_10025 [Actinomycetota bacterium]|nr:hypothetical protein [Actinomycetota bacterium]